MEEFRKQIKRRTLVIPEDFPIESLRCYDFSPKYRVGREKDGGYVIAEGLDYDCFISAGVGDNISFELDFLNSNPPLECHLFDGHVKELPKPHPRIKFVPKNIAATMGSTTTNLHDLLNAHNNIFLKMDVEGGEFPFFSSLSRRHWLNIKQLVVEIHQPFIAERWRHLETLTETHHLIHLHGNNAGKDPNITFYGGITVPYTMEMTYLRKDISPVAPSISPIPSPLDFPNIPSKKDIMLTGFPYNNLNPS